MKEIVLDNNIVVKMRKHRRAKHLKLSIGQDGSVKLTLPYFVPYFQGKAFLNKKKDWLKKHLATISQNKATTNLLPAEEKKLKDIAREKINLLVKHYALLYGVKYNKIFIKNQKSLWGSCSQDKNLNFNWRITLAPDIITRYVIVHEVCHLREMNHSPRFWQLVSLAIPNHQECKKWFKKHGHTLF